MGLRRRIPGIIVGLALIVIGIWLSMDFIVEFAAAAAGLILVMLGMSFLMRR